MLNRNIPLYEGNLPYLYVCYSPEDETLVLPLLGRMYNEGFRIWSACLAERVSDFVAVRHVSTSASVMLFMSYNMRERINAGIPEALAACRSPLLRTVVRLDDSRPDSRLFALTSPDSVDYQRSNDAEFWLYAHSTDYLERCRGPWPEKKVALREPAYEEVIQEAVASEYINLEKIINRGGVRPADIAKEERIPNNRGYIAPGPDELTYVPLAKVEAARTEHDRDYDAALSLLNECAEKQVEIIINHTRPGENTQPAMPSLSPLRPVYAKPTEIDIMRREMTEAVQTEERPERKLDPEVRTKADMVIVPEEKPEPAAPELSAEPEPEVDMSASGIAASIERLTSSDEETAEEPKETTAEETVSAEAIEEETAVPEEMPEADNRGDSMAAAHNAVSGGRSTVQVVVRRQQPAVRVTPVRKRVITETVSASEAHHRHIPRLSRSPFGSRLRAPAAEEKVAFEQYVRDIALAAIASDTETAEPAPVSYRRYGRTARQSVPAALAPTVVPVAAVPAVRSENNAPAAASEPDAAASEQEKSTARKNRYPHNSGVLTGLLAALRRERAAADTGVSSDDTAGEEAVAAYDQAKEQIAAEQHDSVHDGELKVIRLSDAISERKVNDLQAAVSKFMRLEGAGEHTPHIARVYGIRR